MVTIEQVAKAALNGEGLQLRSLAQDFLREHADLSTCTKPNTNDARVLATAASLIEMFAARKHQLAPVWSSSVGALSEPIYLVKAALTMKRLRTLCETEAPPSLRRRRLFAPPNYLEFV